MAVIVQFIRWKALLNAFHLFYVGNTFCPHTLNISVATNLNKGANYNGTIIR